ncbi:MAG: ATP-binding protein [Candidatus Thiodiazotropha sp.]
MALPFHFTGKRGLILLGLLLVYLVLLWQVSGYVRDRAQQEIIRSGERQLNIYVTYLQAKLEKYEFLPELLSTNARLVELLERPGDRDRIEALNRYLETINEITDAADTYLMDRDGLTIAASNWQSEKPFVGRNFSYRPYFKEAMQGHLGRYFALGSTSGKRGYYFAYPVRHQGRILGIVVIKVELTDLEQQWQGKRSEMLVTDPEGVIFITTRQDWRFRSLYPLSDAEKRRLDESRRYSGTKVEPLDIRQWQTVQEGIRRIEWHQGNANSESFLMLEQAMPQVGWRVHLLVSLKQVNQQVWRSMGFVSVAFAGVILLGLILQQRIRRSQERARYEVQVNQTLREARDRLEQRVQERTEDLFQEIEERRRTEQALRQTRDELIQAAKLAMLGQLSASISHELNQPLAAIRSYTDNARRLLEQDRCLDVNWNLEQITELIESMTQISSQLKLFARKTDGSLSVVSLRQVIESSLRILRPQLRKTMTELRLDLDTLHDRVMADPVRLEQVLVNLIANAVNAMEEQTERWVSIATSQRKGHLQVAIQDNGPGIAQDHLKRIFDPFFTTRESGLGLGLSISQHIIESMGGTLTAHNSGDAGAVFVLVLPLEDNDH